MELTEEEIPFNSSDYIFEIKFNGIRALIYAEPGKITIRSHKGKNLNKQYPELLVIKDLVREKCVGTIATRQNTNERSSN